MSTNVKPKHRSASYLAGGALFALLILAVFLRLFLIGAQSLWADEMSSLVTALKPLPKLLYDISNEIHPPLYHLALKVWIYVFGTTEAGIRSLSALCGVVLVGLTYALGQRLFGWKVGLLATALAALAPFQIYYSQEARMYMPLAMIGALAVYAFARFLESEDRTGAAGAPAASGIWLWAGLYVIANGLGLWLHYSYPIILVMENVVYGFWLVLTWKRRSWFLRGVRWTVLQLLALAIYLPWLPLGYRQVSTWPAISESHSLAFILQEAFRLLAVGESMAVQSAGWILIGFAAIFVVGLLPVHLFRNTERSRAWAITPYLLTVFYVLFPILMMYGLSLLKPAYRPKFFLVASPAFCLILARGILGPWEKKNFWSRWATLGWTAASVALVLVGLISSLQNYYFDPRYARDDYRGIARYIAAVEQAGDAVLLNAAGQKDVFDYYYRGNLPVYPLPRSRPLRAEPTVRELEAIATEHDKLYAVFWATEESDPERVIEGWLDSHAYKALDTWHGNVRLVIYSLPQTLAATDVRHPLDVELGDQIALLGYTLQTDAVRVGDVLQLSLFWKALQPIRDRYSVFVHVLDAENHIIGQRDAEPGGGASLTSTWTPGETVVDNYGILVRPGTPSGTYRVELGLYRIDNGQRLVVTKGPDAGADRVLLPPIEIQPAVGPLPLDAFDIQHASNERLGYLELLGYDLYRLGFQPDSKQALRPGDTVHLNLYWQARQALPALEVTISVSNGAGTPIASVTHPLGGTAFPSSTWQVDEIIRDQLDISLGMDVAPGAYAVTGALTVDGQLYTLSLGALQVQD